MNLDLLCRFLLITLAVNYAILLTWFMAFVFAHDFMRKLHGRWFDYQSPGLAQPIPTFPIFHPAFLLRSPAQKRAAWRDLLTLRQKLGSLGIING